ncbi:MAG: LPS export ABC transporter periplasmic protein LptC [Porticoccaceae bacterium]|nr:LPS export ABC transporter periplasmic protein LptC [Porticoccaceae bacterium]
MKNIVLLALAAVALLAFLTFWESPPKLFIRDARILIPESPKADSYMRATFTRKFDDTGILSYTLDSSSGEYFKTGDRLELQQPQLQALNDAENIQPWHLNANSGVIFNTKNRVVMSGKVHAWQQVPAGKNQLRTPRLVFFPDTNTAETQSRVALTSPTGTTTAKGLKANLQQQTYELLSQVKSVHKPQ